MLGICYNFLSNNRFEYEEFTCMAQEVGIGHYTRTKDSITFFYEPIDFFEHQFSLEKLDGEDGKISLQFDVIDYETQSTIDTIQINLFSDSMMTDHVLTGQKKIFETDVIPSWIEISSVDYSSFNFVIKETGSYIVHLYLKPHALRNSYILKTGSESYKIIEFNDKIMRIQNDVYEDFWVFKK